ncbi:hypothetical protein OH146_08720 [Salinibacterium sp. SYSU T00001]|uniref:DUF4190 domain-containing protein n=1 Tax=Homoserinimonas sedimenticola TaxID=2986805 RepID=UPI0022354C9E|nr:DUF4190 domain-containing protein [Salinibacterium sedimenticola]MCW4385855.1 hypothetical protein [Salinibacterium sedimenticola]
MTTATPAPTAENPGKTLGIVGFILAFFVNIAGLIVSIIALVKSKKAGHGNGFAIAGIIVSILSIIAGILIIAAIIAGATAITDAACAELGPGVWELDGGGTLECN